MAQLAFCSQTPMVIDRLALGGPFVKTGRPNTMPKPRSLTPRYAVALLLLAALSTLAFKLQWSRASRPEQSEPAEGLDRSPEAEHLLDEALAEFGSERSPWLEASVRQQVHLAGVAYTAEGRYQTAPGRRCRLEMRSQAGQATGTLLLVSDGRHLWRGRRIGDNAWTSVDRAALGPCITEGGVSKAAPARADNAMQFSGVAPLLQNLRGNLEWVNLTRDAEGHAIVTGVWPAARRAQLAPTGQAWPANMPRFCRLTIDAGSHWPQRVEWWGPQSDDNHNTLLAEMDFGAPVRNQPLTPEVCATTFAFDPGITPVKDQSGDDTKVE